MANIYVRSTTGNDSNNGSTWALAKATLEGARAIAVAGDNIFVSQAHSHALGASSYEFVSPGTTANAVKIIGVNDAAEPPTARSTKPVMTSTTGSITLTGNVEVENMRFQVGLNDSTGTMTASAFSDTNGIGVARIRDCEFSNTSTAGRSVNFQLSTGRHGLSILDRCEFHLGGANGGTQSINITKGRLELNDCWTSATMNTPASLFSLGSISFGHADLVANGFNCSNLASTMALIRGGQNTIVTAIFRNCKFPSGWNETLFSTGTVPTGCSGALHNCSAGSTIIRYLRWDNAGVVRSNETNVRTGGANDGVSYSLRMITGTTSSDVNALLTPELPAVHLSSVGSPVTATVEILANDATAWTNNDAWLEGVFMDNAGDTHVAVTSGRKDTLASAVTLPTSAETWVETGLANPQKRKLQVTFTPQRAGFVHLRVAVAKKSSTVYVDNKITVA